MLLEPVARHFRGDPRRKTRSFDVKVHLPRPDASAPLPEPEAALTDQHVVFTRTYNHGSYTGATAGGGLLTKLAAVDLGDKRVRDVFSFPGYVREPVISPDGKHIAAACWNNGQAQVYLINAVGGQARNVSANAFNDRTPVFRPDGKRLAFVSDRGGDWDIFTMALDGSDVRRLTDSPGADKSPAWSPDGQRLAFISDRGGGFDVYTMDADGKEQRLLLPRDGNEYEPRWSPDGQHIVCTVQRRWNRCLQISEPDGGDPHYVALGAVTNLWSIAWSPDGKTLAAAFSHLGNAGVVIADRSERVYIGQEDWNGERITKLVDVAPLTTMHSGWYHSGAGTPRAVARQYAGVSFAPDGESLVYCSNQPPLVSARQAADRLVELRDAKTKEIAELAEDKRSGRDALREATEALFGEARSVAGFRLYRVNVAGGEPEALAGTDSDWPAVTRWVGR